jgi:hypothetical protein
MFTKASIYKKKNLSTLVCALSECKLLFTARLAFTKPITNSADTVPYLYTIIATLLHSVTGVPTHLRVIWFQPFSYLAKIHLRCHYYLHTQFTSVGLYF